MGNREKQVLMTSTRPDDRGRITLGSDLVSGISKFDVYVDKDSGEILLKPFKEVSAREAWLYENKKAYELVHSGLNDAKNERLSSYKVEKLNWLEED